jgi:hypothetical protein
MLQTSGSLNPKRPAGSPAQELKMIEMRDNGPEARTVNEKADAGTHRSVYLPLLRGVTPRSLEAFDPVEQSLVTGSRDTTTVPAQALYLLNSEFVRRQSLNLAERLLRDTESTDDKRLQAAYRLTLGRVPSEKEIAQARAFLGDYEVTYHAQAAKQPSAKKTAPQAAVQPKKPADPLANPDEADQTGEPVTDSEVHPKDAHSAAWMAFIQVLFSSAEFRYVR